MLKTLGNTSSVNDIIDTLQKDGAVIVEGLMSPKTMLKLDNETKSLLNQTSNCKGYFFGFETKRIGSMVGKSQACRELATNLKILSVMDHFLLPHCSDYQLNLSQLIDIGPGEKGQIIHADDPLFPFDHSTDMQVMINVMWAIDDFTEENGATRAIAGSHLWERDRHPENEPVEKAVMKKGSCFIWLGSTRHGGGANHSLERRRGVVISYNLGWLKSTDNHFLSIPMGEVKKYPQKLQRLLGYFVHKPNLNVVDGRDPIELLSDQQSDGTFKEFLPEGIEEVLIDHYNNQGGSISEVRFK